MRYRESCILFQIVSLFVIVVVALPTTVASDIPAGANHTAIFLVKAAFSRIRFIYHLYTILLLLVYWFCP